jgi:diaminohydroxyphosphoribosylaminopyrimidine deaminase/5-amino-6-(5-phosphoribosylamino)uracil reductase
VTEDELFMRRAIELASLGMGYVSPNPLVGCVIVHEGKIIGEGWHNRFGEAHAEVNAVNDVFDKTLLSESSVYVNLEPCSHFGKTPPCADMLVQLRVKKVVVSNLDPNPLVAGNGIRKLRDAGVEVISGVLQQEGKVLNRRFFTFMEKDRPYIILKWAETADGFMAHESYESRWISNDYSRQLVHRWRAEEDAALVGTRTAQHDNPRLNVRDWSGRNPVRVVFDRFLRLNDNLHLFDHAQPTICYNLMRHQEEKNLILVRIGEERFWEEMLHDLHGRGIQSVMVEGGAQTLQTFISGGWWDEARIFRSNRVFEKGIAAPKPPGHMESTEHIMGDQLSIYMGEVPLHRKVKDQLPGRTKI